MTASKHLTRTSKEQGNVTAADTEQHGFPGDADKQRSVADVIGIFADEPLWDEVMTEVKAFRVRQDSVT